MKWLAEKQSANGSFPEVGTVSHRDMQGGAARGLALTAYVLSAFLEVEVRRYLYQFFKNSLFFCCMSRKFKVFIKVKNISNMLIYAENRVVSMAAIAT